jgi:hypothetical protein
VPCAIIEIGYSSGVVIKANMTDQEIACQYNMTVGEYQVMKRELQRVGAYFINRKTCIRLN